MTRLLQTIFWSALIAFIIWDWQTSAPINPYLEAPAIALGSGQKSAGGHCSNTAR
jgi:hypothetical protein